MEIKPDIKWLKVSSGDVTNAPLLLKIAQTGKPVIFSTGMATIGEIELALGTLAFGYMHKDEQPSGIADIKSAYNSLAGQEILKRKIILLHCTTQYPTNPQDVNLKAMDTLKDIFDFPVGYSDHTQGGAISVAAVARGSVVIEKHFTTSHQLPGPDQAASMEPQLFKQMVEDIRKVEIALGSGRKLPTAVELQNSPVVRKSIVADRLIFKGQEFSEENIIPKSPEGGISPFYYWDLLGKCAKRDYANDEMIDFHIE
jgi:N-acetylneuraminate synthase